MSSFAECLRQHVEEASRKTIREYAAHAIEHGRFAVCVTDEEWETVRVGLAERLKAMK